MARLVVCLLLLSLTVAAQTFTADTGGPAPLVVEVLDPHHPRNEGRLRPQGLPLVFEGMQVQSLNQLRAWLRLRANPMKHPDKSVPEIAPGFRASRKRLLIRCDAGQVFGWVQALMQCCTFVPGNQAPRELQESPLIHRIDLELADTGRRLNSNLPVDKGTADAGRGRLSAEIILKIPKAEWGAPAHEREIIFLKNGSNTPFGRSKGLAYHSVRPGHYSMLFDPPDTMLRIRNFLAVVRKADGKSNAKLNAHPRTPIAYAFELVEAMREEGFDHVSYSGIPTGLIKEIESGALDGPGGLASLLDAVRAAEPAIADPIATGPGAFGGRRSDRRNLRAQGGGGKTQRAVDRGLAWLAGHQSPDGRWDADGFGAHCDHDLGKPCTGKGIAAYDVGLTGLSLLAFLGAGNTHRQGIYKATVRKGLAWLKKQQDAEGCFGPRGDPHFTYNHAIAALAMAEAFGMTRSGIWKSSAQNGINYVMKCQNPYKAWRYGERPGDNDVSVTSWMVMALKSAKASGLDVNENAFMWAHDFIREMTDEETGRTGYTRRGERPVRPAGAREAFPAQESESLTAAGILIRIFCGEDPKQSPMIKAGAELLTKRLPTWEPAAGKVDMYYWYYGTLAMFQIGGAEWKAWNRGLQTAVLASQRLEGGADGSWDPVGPWGKQGGRVYSTALMTICMEVYYRYGRVFGSRK